MGKEELLKRRFELIALWPGCGWSIGTIFPENFDRDFSNYPHLFNELQWWEHREVKDMPEMVMDEQGTIFKATWDRTGKQMYMHLNNGDHWHVTEGVMEFFQPA